MNILLKLFLTFLKIGAVSFGGGYAMIAVIREACLENDWLTEEELMNLIAVAESTPGPIAVNAATFVGSTQAGILGSLLATLGIVLPSFVIILIIVSVLQNLMKYKPVKAALEGIRPVTIGLICATGFTMLFKSFFGSFRMNAINVKNIAIFAILAVVAFLFKKLRKKEISPILLILISAVLGMVLN